MHKDAYLSILLNDFNLRIVSSNMGDVIRPQVYNHNDCQSEDMLNIEFMEQDETHGW